MSHSEMCKHQGDLQRAVSPRAVCAYLRVCRSTGKCFFFNICAQYMVLIAVCDSIHGPMAFL